MPGFDQVSPLKIDLEQRRNCQIFRVSGIFDVFSVPTFRSRLYQAVEASVEGNPENFILDLTDIDLIDPSILEALVELCQKIRNKGGRLQIVGGPRVTRVIQRIRLEQFLSLQPNLDAAVKNLEKRESDTEGRQVACGI